MVGIVHTGITVTNLGRAIEFYRDVLGLEVMLGPADIYRGERFAAAVGVPGATLRLAMLQAGGDTVELFEYLAPESPVERPLPPNALGTTHVAFRVKDICARLEELKAKGVEFLSEPMVATDGQLKGWKWVYFRDPDGVTLELIQTE